MSHLLGVLSANLPLTSRLSWDYRFSWIRDASFTVYALIRLGFTAEATAYMEFMQSRIQASDPDKPLQIVFGIRGETDLSEVCR